MVKYFGGTSTTNLFDNTKTMVVKSDRYEPTMTNLCHQLTAHYQTTFTATRPYEPRDTKGRVVLSEEILKFTPNKKK